jgi:DinB superfamily
MARRPVPGKWSPAECIEHLAITSDAYFPLWQTALAEARVQGLRGSGSFRMDWKGRILAWMLEPPARMRMPAPPGFVPKAIGGTDAVGHFLSGQERLLEVAGSSQELALDGVQITSPFSKNLRYSVWSSFVVTAAHQRRHLWQAERAAGGNPSR